MGVRTNTSRLGRALLFDVTSNYKYWIGVGANTTWTNTANWAGGQVPANDTVTDYAVFDQASAYTRQPNSSQQSVLGLRFTGAADITGTGSIIIGSGGVYVGSNAGAVTITSVKIVGEQNWTVESGKNLILSTYLSVSGNNGTFNKRGAGILTIGNGSNQFDGLLRHYEGILNIVSTVSPSYAWGDSQALEIWGGVIDNLSGAAKTTNPAFVTIDSFSICGDFTFSNISGTANNNLRIAGIGNLNGGTRTITCLGSGQLQLDGIIGPSGTAVTGGIIKEGPGSLYIPSHKHDTTVANAGFLKIDSKTSTGGTSAGTTIVNSGAILQISSTYIDVVTVAGGGSFQSTPNGAPFNTIGGLVFSSSSSKLIVSTPSSSSSCNKWTTTDGNVIALNGVTVDFDQTNGLSPGTYIIITNASGFTGSATKGVNPSGVATANWSLSISGTNLRVIVV
jgi:hypothetical protein